ncbi:MAG: DUF2065 family protein [Hansschlegelia sp.]
MSDFVAALGLVLAIEGILFAGLPGSAKRAAENIIKTPEGTLRTVGVASAVVGVLLVWFVRG